MGHGQKSDQLYYPNGRICRKTWPLSIFQLIGLNSMISLLWKGEPRMVQWDLQDVKAGQPH